MLWSIFLAKPEYFAQLTLRLTTTVGSSHTAPGLAACGTGRGRGRTDTPLLYDPR